MSAKSCSSPLRASALAAPKRSSLKLLLVMLLGSLLGLFAVTTAFIYQHQQAQRVTQSTALVLEELIHSNKVVYSKSADHIDQVRQRFSHLVQVLSHGGQLAHGEIPALEDKFQLKLSQLSRQWHARVPSPAVSPWVADAPELADRTHDLLYRHDAFDLLLGYVHDREQLQYTYQVWIWALLAVNAIAAFGFWVWMRYYALRPLDTLSVQAKSVLEGHYAAHTLSSGAPEFTYISRVMGLCSQQVDYLLGQLNVKREKLSQLHNTYRTLTATPLIGVYMASQGRFTFVNRKLAQTLGYKRSVLLDQIRVDQVFLEPRFPCLTMVAEPLNAADCNSRRYQTRALCGTGEHIDVEISEVYICLEGTATTVAIVQDISNRVRSEVSGRIAGVVYENTSEAIVVTDRYGVIVEANPAFSSISGYELDEVRGRALQFLGSIRQNDAFYQKIWAQVRETGRWQGDIWSRRKSGDDHAERLTISTAWNPDGTVYRFIALFTDISAHKEREVQMWKQAHYDHLTGLPNRQMFHDRLQVAMDRARSNGMPFALIFMDLDYFKDVNDSLGHKEGDTLLQEVATRLQSCVRDTDTVARIGGDEFTVIVTDIADDAVVDRICQQMLKSVSRPFVLGSNTATVSASLGITLFPEDAHDAGELIKNADMAMYAAKACGRNQFCRFLPAMGEAVQAKMRFSQDLQTALKEHQFRLYYQPVLDLKTGVVTKAEALIRWEHPQLGLVPPSEFIPFSEDSGLIVAIGEWVFENAAMQAAYLRSHLHPDFQVSLNVSAAQLKLNPSCVDDWLTFLDNEGIPGQALIVEITERLLLDGNEQTLGQLRKLRQNQVGVALDDFGTGYSSLSYLKRFAISLLKIDQCYIRNLAAEAEDMALVQAMVAMAHTLGLGVVAEGVDKQEQVGLLKRLGCDMLQGYWCSPPIAAAQFEQWCREWNERAV